MTVEAGVILQHAHEAAEAAGAMFPLWLASQGSAVYIEGLHMCMAARGVGAHEARLVTSAVRGVFLELATREEFIKLVTASHPNLV